MPALPTDGLLFREQGRPEVYLIRDGERLHIPNPYMMQAMGLDWNAVQVVPLGFLNQIPLDHSWEPLGNATPGSAVHVPVNVGLGKTYWPLRLATTKRFTAWGYEVRTIELRGWISPPGPGGFTAYAADPDFTYHLEIDADWAIGQGIDLNELVRVGNILQLGRPEPGVSDHRAWCATPLIKLEIVGFPPKGQRDRAYPPDWTFTDPAVVLNAPDAGAAKRHPVRWPFNPAAPPSSNKVLMGGEYVRVFGSIVTDQRHNTDPAFKTFWSTIWLWATGDENSEDDRARWTEVHPPDWIEIVDPPSAAPPIFRGVTVVSRGTWPLKAPIPSVLDVDIMAPAKPAEHPNWVLRCTEIVGPETVYDTITEGNPGKNGAAITTLTNPDGIHLHVKVSGTRSFTGGSSGKFRALYLLDWVAPPPPVPQRVTVPNVVGSRAKDALDRIRAAGLVPHPRGPQGITARVIDQQPAGGTLASRGSSVTLSTEVTN